MNGDKSVTDYQPKERQYIEGVKDIEDTLKRVRYYLGWGYLVNVSHGKLGYILKVEKQPV